MSKLKPCPFCGSEAVGVRSKHESDRHLWDGTRIYRAKYSVRCFRCKARGSIASGWIWNVVYGQKPKNTVNPDDLRKQAIEAWNRRVNEDV